MSTVMEVLDKAEQYVTAHFQNHVDDDSCAYHNLQHTREVVAAAKEIGAASGLTEEEIDIVVTAAWFHDTGFSNSWEDHETYSIETFEQFNQQLELPAGFSEQVVACIEATRMPQNPQNLIERVLCDADLYHLSTDLFEEKGELLRAEWAMLQGKKVTDAAWHQESLVSFKEH